MLPKATRGKGERDQRGFQYTTVHRMVGRLSMPIARRTGQMETGGVPPEVGSAGLLKSQSLPTRRAKAALGSAA